MFFLRLLLLLLIVLPVFAMDGEGAVADENDGLLDLPLVAEYPPEDEYDYEENLEERVKLTLQSTRGRREIEVNLATIKASNEIYHTYQDEKSRHHGVVEINLDIENIHAFVHAFELLDQGTLDFIDNDTFKFLILYAGRFDIVPLWPIVSAELDRRKLDAPIGVTDFNTFCAIFDALRAQHCQSHDIKAHKLKILNWLSDYIITRKFHDENYRRVYRQLVKKFKTDETVSRALGSNKQRMDKCSKISQSMVAEEQAAIYAEKARDLYDDKIFPKFSEDVQPGKPYTMYIAVPYADADKIAAALKRDFPGFGVTVDVRLSDDKPFPNNIYCCRDMLPFLSSDLTKDWQGCVSYAIAWAINAMGPCLAKTLTCGCCCSCGRDLKQQENCESAIKDALTDDTTGRCIFENVYKLITSMSTCCTGPTRMLRIVDNSYLANDRLN